MRKKQLLAIVFAVSWFTSLWTIEGYADCTPPQRAKITVRNETTRDQLYAYGTGNMLTGWRLVPAGQESTFHVIPGYYYFHSQALRPNPPSKTLNLPAHSRAFTVRHVGNDVWYVRTNGKEEGKFRNEFLQQMGFRRVRFFELHTSNIRLIRL